MRIKNGKSWFLASERKRAAHTQSPGRTNDQSKIEQKINLRMESGERKNEH